LRVVFAGTPAFAVPALDALVQARHDVALVLTQPDRPSGRGLRLNPSPVALCATRHGLRVSKPESLRATAAQEELRTVAPDLMVVAAYGLILPQAVLDIPTRGCINIHGSLLPRWRGAAPVQRAILAGDRETGISIMCMEAGLDTGPVLLERAIPIDPDDTTGSLTEKLATLGAECLVEAIGRLDTLSPRTQDPAGATYASKIAKSEAVVDWTRPAEEIERQVRAFNPAPGAEATVRGLHLKIWEANAIPDDRPAGEAFATASGLLVGCGSGSLRLGVVQRPGGRRMGADEFLRGSPWPSVPTGSSTH
jgi:methionyl-tRNA formyltransferase